MNKKMASVLNLATNPRNQPMGVLRVCVLRRVMFLASSPRVMCRSRARRLTASLQNVRVS